MAFILAGATGFLGEKIAKELIAQDAHVRALVRATSNRTKLENLGITDFVTGDMMDPASLEKALAQSPKADAVVASAAGYTRHTKGDNPKTDTDGYKNLADATKAANISRFVLLSILECDKAPEVPHFYHKHLAEDISKRNWTTVYCSPGGKLSLTRQKILSCLKSRKAYFRQS